MNFSTVNKLKDFIIEKGCSERNINLRILDSTFVPAYKIFRRLSSRFDFKGKRVLDLGCAYGQFLINFDGSSLGIDVQDKSFAFASSLGLRVIKQNVEEGLNLDEKYDVIFCRQLLDHLVSPHKLLVEFHQLLKDNGYLIVNIDNIDYLFAKRIASEHLYGFNLKALKILVLRSGFNIIKAFTLTSNKPRIFERLVNSSSFLLSRSMELYIIATKNPTYKYPEKRLPWFSPSWLPGELERQGE